MRKKAGESGSPKERGRKRESERTRESESESENPAWHGEKETRNGYDSCGDSETSVGQTARMDRPEGRAVCHRTWRGLSLIHI